MLNAVNPYIAGSPVTGPEMFFGREDVFTFIRQALIGKHRDNIIVLYGQRRTGKTSTLYQLPSHLGPHYLCVFVDLQALHLEGIDGFLWELANHIQRVLQREHQIELPHLERQEFLTDARNFFQYKFLDQVWSIIGDRHLLLMLDEAIRLEEQVQTGKLEDHIFEYMSHIMQHYEKLNFLFSLSAALEEMEKRYSLLFRTAIYKKISFLDQATTNALITKPVRGLYEVEDAAQERIFQITSGNPFCIQLLCHSLFNRWQQRSAELITVQDVEQVLDEAVERGLAVFKHIWDESTSAEKAVMAVISEITSDADVAVSTDSINQAWEAYNIRIPQGEMIQALRSLMARDVIKGTHKYVFCVDLQRLWIQKYQRFDWVAEKLEETKHSWIISNDTIVLAEKKTKPLAYEDNTVPAPKSVENVRQPVSLLFLLDSHVLDLWSKIDHLVLFKALLISAKIANKIPYLQPWILDRMAVYQTQEGIETRLFGMMVLPTQHAAQ